MSIEKNHPMKHFSLHKFTCREDIPFNVESYSKLKFGSGKIAKRFGYELAEAVFENYQGVLLTNDIIVYESAYSYVKNAASLLTEFFIRRINQILISNNGKHVTHARIHRNIPYIADYGKLQADARRKLLESDKFSFDKDYFEGKFGIFIDDVLITGAHHEKIYDMLEDYRVFHEDQCLGVYYGELISSKEDPAIESYLNTAYVKNVTDLIKLINKDDDYRVIVRTLKLILSSDVNTVKELMNTLPEVIIDQIYNLCLGEGYYRNISYANTFAIIQQHVLEHENK